MREVPSAYRCGRIHCIRLRQSNASVAFRVQQLPQLCLLGVVRACRIAGRGPDPAILLANQLGIGQRLPSCISPMLASYALVKVLGARFGQAICQSLEHDARVVVVSSLELRHMPLDSDTRSDCKTSNVITHTSRLRRNVVGQALMRLSRCLTLLL